MTKEEARQFSIELAKAINTYELVGDRETIWKDIMKTHFNHPTWKPEKLARKIAVRYESKKSRTIIS